MSGARSQILLPVRHYECDAYGHLNNVSYVHYLHEAGLQRDASIGGPAGAARRTTRLDIEYLRPVRYGETVEVRLTGEGCDGRFLRRAFELRVHGSDDLSATALVEVEGEPPPLSDAWAGGNSPQMEVMPPLPAPPPGVFTVRHRVTWQDLDMNRAVPDTSLLRFTEVCGMGVIAAHGWPAQRMVAEGFAIILRRNRSEYYAPAALDDEVEIATWVSDVKRVTAMRHYTIKRVGDGALLARIDTLGVWVDLSTGRPMRIPVALMADFAPNVTPR